MSATHSFTLAQLQDLVKLFVEEYEHGSADIEDVHPGMTVEMYVAVVDDLLLGLEVMLSLEEDLPSEYVVNTNDVTLPDQLSFDFMAP